MTFLTLRMTFDMLTPVREGGWRAAAIGLAVDGEGGGVVLWLKGGRRPGASQRTEMQVQWRCACVALRCVACCCAPRLGRPSRSLALCSATCDFRSRAPLGPAVGSPGGSERRFFELSHRLPEKWMKCKI